MVAALCTWRRDGWSITPGMTTANLLSYAKDDYTQATPHRLLGKLAICSFAFSVLLVMTKSAIFNFCVAHQDGCQNVRGGDVPWWNAVGVAIARFQNSHLYNSHAAIDWFALVLAGTVFGVLIW